MDFIFKLYAQKLFWVQNFNQIRETTIFCPFGVKITNFSKMIKCSQNRIDLQIVNTKTVLGAKFQPNQRNYNILPFLPFYGVKITKCSKMDFIFKLYNTKTVLGTKFQPNQRNYNILPFWGQNYKLFKNDKMFIESQICKLYAHKLFWVQNFSQIRETTIFCPFCHFGVKITNFSKMDFIFKLYAQKLFWVQNFSQIRETTIFCPFCHFGVKITNFSKMDLIFKFYKRKLFVHNFNQIRETTIF